MTFYDIKQKYNKFNFKKYIKSVSCKMIEDSIHKEILNEFDLLNLLSPKALIYINEIAKKAHEISIRHFGKCILLYAPLYVSNFCTNNCVYCGFSIKNKIKRNVLSFDEIDKNCKIISNYGIHHILLVTGESNIKTPLNYLKKCIEILKNYFEDINVEIYPLNEYEYETLANCGVDGLTIYQETYDENIYKILHTKGKKSNYRYRLETCERAGEKYRNLNIGALLGLNDFITDVFFVGIHAKYLQTKFKSTEIGVSFPRIRPTTGIYNPKILITDENLVQAICSIRLFINRININISTRESKKLRNNLIQLGVTKMSAASRTDVGGYAKKQSKHDGQFEVNDTSTVNKVKEMIYKNGYQPIMKDWILL
ncbi:MAG: 2-iminoacetate synthase ThiH [Endomicrobium sp.]|jgi:2-iminoacetate synthase|nr:2-iminoacetate synthase ThiH [Endomicrobium sp.]